MKNDEKRIPVGLKIKPSILKKIKKYAEQDNRSFNNYVENLMIEDIEIKEGDK